MDAGTKSSMASSDDERGKKAQRGLNPQQWAEARKAFEQGEAIASLSRRFNVRRQTIGQRMKRECWTVHPSVQVDEQTVRAVHKSAQAKVIDIATRQVVDDMQKAGVIDDAAALLSETLTTWLRIKKHMARAGESFAIALANGEIKAAGMGERDRSQVMKDSVAALKALQSVIREDEGLRPGTPTFSSETEEKRVDQLVLVVRERQESA